MAHPFPVRIGAKLDDGEHQQVMAPPGAAATHHACWLRKTRTGKISRVSPTLPPARGPLSAAVINHLAQKRGLPDPDRLLACVLEPLTDDDLHLALWCCYEMHHHGFEGVDDALEWDPDLLAFRSRLERAFETALRAEVHAETLPLDPAIALRIISEWASPPLAATIESSGTIAQLREFAIHRSAYQLKEADAHTFALPRLRGPGRAAMIEIQADEYGSGRRGEAHSELFADAMCELGLSSEFGHFVDRLPGATLATDNLVEMFALHRRLRGALIGHLALFEITSVTPMSHYLSAARRLGGLPAVERFYEVHVEADAHHGHIAMAQMVAGFVADEPHLAAEMVFGAAALSRVESRFARHLLTSWNEDRSSLLEPAPALRATDGGAPDLVGPGRSSPPFQSLRTSA